MQFSKAMCHVDIPLGVCLIKDCWNVDFKSQMFNGVCTRKDTDIHWRKGQLGQSLRKRV